MRRIWSIAAAALAAAACSGGGHHADDPDGRDPDPDRDGATSDGATGDGSLVDAPAATDPALPGTWQVLVRDDVSIPVASQTVRGTVFVPSSDGVNPGAGRFPLVVVSSGYQLARAQYRPLCQHLASWGYLCLTHDYASSGNHQAKAAEVGDIIDWALAPAGDLAAHLDGAAIATAGHSLGGKVSINAAILDPRVKAVVGWDPVDALPPFGNDGSLSVTPELMGSLRVPLAVIGELTDATGSLGMACAPSADNYQRYFEAACAAPAAIEVTVDHADHMDWIADPGSCGLACLACRSGSTPAATVHEITRRLTTAWLERWLRGDPGAAAWLTADRIGAPTSLRTTVPGCS